MPASGPSAASLTAAFSCSTTRLAGCLEGQVDDRAGGHRRPDGDPVELAGELREHEADRLRRPGRGRDEVDGRGPRPPQVLVGHVLEALVRGVGVDRGHQPTLDAHGVVQDLGHGRQTVGGARSVGDDVVPLRVVGLIEIDPQCHGHVGIGRGRRDDDLLGARREMLGGVVALGEEARRLDHDIDAEVRPGQVRGIPLRQDLDLGAVDGDRPLALLESPGNRPRMESYLSRYARVLSSVMSLTATNSRSLPAS